jgi:ABC-type sugar transport system substrate-binding protein
VNKRILILMAGAFAAASGLSAHAQDSQKKPETVRQTQENAWYDAERERGSSRSLADIPFPVPRQQATPDRRPETDRQAAENEWLTRERDQEAGNTEPVPYPVPPSMQDN